ncbi:hypothetical protein ACERK3_16705 [Phycisphaerales bacterium AB-hyl4]|uniref:Tetratricopeptide repeat protein n=1 Tax=Natronomicrosphaera hydrolytica TaxID=3242702 RepID=A0ABV4U8K3_9BACT
MSEANFTPPTTEQVETLLDEHPLRSPSPLAAWGPLIGLVALLVVVLVIGGIWGVILPWLGLGVLLGYLMLRMRRVRQVEQRVTRAQELAMLRHHQQALAMGWRLLPKSNTSPATYLRTMTLIGHCLEELKVYEGAIACFDRLLDVLPQEHPGAVHLRIHRAIAALGCERLLDADDGLSRLRGTMGQYPQSPLSALYRLADLIQAVRTGHYADPLREADTLLAELRPLGVEAGYGHGLMAVCYHHARPDASDEHGRSRQREQSAMWWQRATTLLPSEALVARFPELAVMQAEAGDT